MDNLGRVSELGGDCGPVGFVHSGWITMNGEDWCEADYSGGARRAQSEKEEPHASHRIA